MSVRLTLAAAMAAVVASAGFAATALDPQTLVLRVGDLKSFRVSSTTVVPLAEAGRGKPPGWRQKLVQWGYRSAFVADFREPATDRRLSSQAVVLGSERGARAYLAAIFRSPPAPSGLRRVALGKRIGHESRLYIQYLSQDGVRMELQYLGWRNRNVFAGVVLIQERAKLDATGITSFASTQNARIERALSR